MIPTRMTALAHQLVRPSIRPGDIVIDATCGNGHDTLFLADAVGPGGTVYAIDLQEQAIDASGERLNRAQCSGWVQLIQSSHAELSRLIAPEHHGHIRAVLFNLGYLPGTDKQCTTEPETTLQALNEALSLLAPEGLLSLVVYPGHKEGAAESQAIQAWLPSLEGYTVTECRHTSRRQSSPYLLIIQRDAIDQSSTMPTGQ